MGDLISKNLFLFFRVCECLSKGNKRNKISKLKYIKTKQKEKKLNQKQEKEKKSQLRKEKNEIM